MRHDWKKKKKAENKYLGGFFPCVIDQKVLFGVGFFVCLFASSFKKMSAFGISPCHPRLCGLCTLSLRLALVVRGASPEPRPRNFSSGRAVLPCPGTAGARRDCTAGKGPVPGKSPCPPTALLAWASPGEQGAFLSVALPGRGGPEVSSSSGEGSSPFSTRLPADPGRSAHRRLENSLRKVVSGPAGGAGLGWAVPGVPPPPASPPCRPRLCHRAPAGLCSLVFGRQLWKRALLCLVFACLFVSPVAVWGWCPVLAARAGERSPQAAASPGDGGCGRRAGARPSLSRRGRQRGGGWSVCPANGRKQRRASQVKKPPTNQTKKPPPHPKNPPNAPIAKPKKRQQKSPFRPAVSVGAGTQGGPAVLKGSDWALEVTATVFCSLTSISPGRSKPSLCARRGLGAVFIFQMMPQDEQPSPAPVPRGGAGPARPGVFHRASLPVGSWRQSAALLWGWVFFCSVGFFVGLALGFCWVCFFNLVLSADREGGQHFSRGTGDG